MASDSPVEVTQVVFAVTSGLRQDVIQTTIDAPERILSDYEDYKNEYKDTKTKCNQEGFAFTPLVFEAHGGGWSAAARRICGHIAKQQVSAGFTCKEGTSLRIAQRISTALQVANARAILKRLSQGAGECVDVFDLEAADAPTDDEML